MFELDDYQAGYVAGFAVGASFVLVALWLADRDRRRRQLRDAKDLELKLLMGALAEIEELKSRIPQEVAE